MGACSSNDEAGRESEDIARNAIACIQDYEGGLRADKLKPIIKDKDKNKKKD